MATFFSLSGYHIQKHNWTCRCPTWICFSVTLVCSIIMPCNLLAISWWQIPLYSVGAISGTLLTLQLSEYIARTNTRIMKILLFVGNNTLPILIWHFLCFKLVTLLRIILEHRPITDLALFPVIIDDAHIWFMLYFIVGVAIPSGITYFLQYGKKNIYNHCKLSL